MKGGNQEDESLCEKATDLAMELLTLANETLPDIERTRKMALRNYNVDIYDAQNVHDMLCRVFGMLSFYSIFN